MEQGLFCQAYGLIAAIFILYKTEQALNRMNVCTRFSVRFSMWLLLVAAILKIYDILQGNIPSFEVLIFLTAVCSLLFAEQRIRELVSKRIDYVESR